MNEGRTTQPIHHENGLVALDWGTSSLRAWRLSESGDILQARHEGWGIMHLPEGGFPAAFAAITKDWFSPAQAVPAIACGMVGSRQGWREVPYVPTPAGLAQLADGLLRLDAGAGVGLHLVPGVLETGDPAAPDVIRGEETQALGAFHRLEASRQDAAETLLVMPGTHSKWARLRDRQLVSFRTAMTGEVFALLLGHSILGRGVTGAVPVDPAACEAAFRSGVLAAHEHGAFARLFQARALTLTGALEPGCVPDYLSGLLIGEELRIAASDLASAGQLAITGDASLCERYGRAFAIIGTKQPARIDDTALDGLRRIAFQAGLLPGFIPIGAN